jgi:hypothetical protein
MSLIFRDRDLSPELRERIELRRQAMVVELEQIAEREGKVLFEMQWMTPDEVRRAHRRLRLRSLQICFELGMVFVVFFLGIILIGFLAASLIGV